MNWHTASLGVAVGVGATLMAAPSAHVSGGLGGQWSPPGADAPVVTWQADFDPSGAQLRLVVSAQAPAETLAVSGELALPQGERVGEWRIDAGRISLAAWQSTLRAWLPTAAAAWELAGEVQLSGQGPWPWREEAGGVAMQVNVSDLAVADPGREFSWRAGRLDGRLTGAGALRMRVYFESGQLGSWILGPTSLLLLRADAAAPWQLAEARVEIAGGRVEIKPLAWAGPPERLEAEMQVRGLALALLQPFLGEVLASAVGRVEGDLQVTWTAHDGWDLSAGRLQLMAGFPAKVHLQARPGLLTADISADHPAHGPLRRIELGATGLAVKVLRIELLRSGPADQAAGRMHLEAEPMDPGLIAPVILDVNVHGDIKELISLGGRTGKGPRS